VILREREFRASDINCGRTDGGQFAPRNDCASGSGGTAVAARPKDDSWKQESGTKEWTSSDLKKSSPVKGGEKLEALTIRDVKKFRTAQSEHGLNIDEIVTLGGGAIRGAEMWLASYSHNDISVSSQIPIDPDDPDKGSVESSIEISKENGSSYIEYGTMFPDDGLDLDAASQNRIASVMMERMLESMSMASDAGFSHAQMLAIGSADSKDKGYRLWPQFGFDAKLPQELFAKIPKEILDKTPRVAKSSKLSRKSLTIQELISTREGERWWDENGDSLDMKIEFSGDSLGLKRFEEMKAKLPRLKERNKRRSYFDWLDDVEYRAGLDCGRTEGGQFAADNDCAGGGGGSSEPQARDRDDSWMQNAGDDSLSMSGRELKESPPLAIPGADGLKSVTIKSPKNTAAALKAFQITLDDLATLSGGAREGGSMEFKASSNRETLSSYSFLPLEPSDPESLQVMTHIDLLWDDGGYNGGRTIYYGEMFPQDSGGGEVELSQAQQSQIASLLMQRMSESMSLAEKSGIVRATTYAAGNKESNTKGYRLWPQFGFDAKLRSFRLEALRKSIADGKLTLNDSQKSQLDKEELTVQQLIATREGEKWWDDNGRGTDLTFDFRDKSSLGYKRYEEMKARIARLKERNKNRSIIDWLEDEVEFRDDCGRQEGGRFGRGNDCASEDGGAATATKPDDSWWESEGEAQWGRAKLKDSPPVTGGEVLKSFIVRDVGELASAMTDIGSFKSFDDVVAIGGGVRKGGKVIVEGDGDVIRVNSTMPISPDGTNKDGAVEVNVAMFDNGEGLAISYDEMYVDRPEDGEITEESVKRVSSVLLEKMTDSLARAESIGAQYAETMAAGDAHSPLKGYRLWPQFGFDGELGKIHTYGLREFAEEAIANRGEDNYDNPPKWALDIVDKLDSGEPLMIQELISSAEGKKWWDENGKNIPLMLKFKDKKSLGYKRYKKMKTLLTRLKERNKNRNWYDYDVEFRGDCTDADRQDGGQFGQGNDCGGEGGVAGSVQAEAKAGKQRNVDVMIGGQKTVAVIDKEARDRAIADFKANKPEGSTPGSTTDLWDRTFVSRGGKSTNKITESDPVFPPETHRQNGQFVAHEAVGQFLANRHEEERQKTGATGPGAIIDTASPDLPEAQLDYLAESLTDDALHAYDVLGVDPGFYSTDLDDTMKKMTSRYPEFETDDDAKFVFTMLLAITSTGQGPDANLRDADDLYRMYREHGTVVPSNYGGGARDVTASLKVLQGLLDSFGKERTRRLLSGYTTAGNVEKTLAKLAGKSQAEEWQQRTGASAWSLPVDRGGDQKQMVSGELRDEVVPVAAIFGPKIGSFFANLSGKHDFLTMDRWLMRSVGRVSGELITRSTPKQAKERAEAILKAIESGKWNRAKLFGVDKTHGITKEQLVRSLKIQAKTGVIEENGAAFLWATAAERSHGKTRRPTGGGYGKHEDPEIHALHQAGNSLFKSLIHEQQDPKTGTARKNIREVFRRVQSEIEARTGRKADIDEIQAALWQYEKRLWKHLGAQTNITDNSLFSAAADGVLSGRLARSKDQPSAKPFTPASRRDAQQGEIDDRDEEFDVNPLDVEQSVWNADFADLDIDVLALIQSLEDDVEERRNFLPLDLVESRSADCGRDQDGKFGSGNKCQMGININDKHQDFTGQILSGEKTLETRPSNSLRPYVGKTVGIVRTGKGKATLVGTMKIGEPKFYKTQEEFDADFEQHRVGKDSPHYIGPDGKYGYPISEVKKVKPVVITAQGRVARKITSRDYDEETIEYSLDDEQRSADCGRDEDGKFGSGNKCQEDGTATATASGSDDRWSSNSEILWPASSRETAPPPFDGADKYGTVSVKAPQRVQSSLESAGIDAATAVAAAGGTPDSDVYMRPGTEFGSGFGFSETPVFIDFESDIAGIEGAMNHSAAIGKGEDGSVLIFQNTATVTDEIARDPAKRHAAAAAFYRTMVSSVESARKAGASQITLNAAGSAAADSGKGKASNPWRGFTIWPRMGFDARLPQHLVSKLPPDLSHAKSLLDLHATPEGTRWWAENGEDLDVYFNLKDRSSPQSKIMDRFIRKFGSGAQRRDMPLGSGDEWLSPADLVRLDEMWQEIWDEGDLDDYEWSDDGNS
jgi:hypothetical protein